MKNMQRIILAFLLLFAIISILMVTRQMKAASTEATGGRVTAIAPALYHNRAKTRLSGIPENDPGSFC